MQLLDGTDLVVSVRRCRRRNKMVPRVFFRVEGLPTVHHGLTWSAKLGVSAALRCGYSALVFQILIFSLKFYSARIQ